MEPSFVSEVLSLLSRRPSVAVPGKRSRLRNRIELGRYLLLRSLFRLLPLRVADGLGPAGAGLLYRLVDRRRRRLVSENLALAFPGTSPAEVDRLARDVFAHFGGTRRDLPPFRDGADRAPPRRASRSSGSSTRRAAAASGRGVFFATPHLGNWEWAALVAGARGLPMTVVARPLDNPLLDARLTAMREKTGCTGSSASGTPRGRS